MRRGRVEAQSEGGEVDGGGCERCGLGCLCVVVRLLRLER